MLRKRKDLVQLTNKKVHLYQIFPEGEDLSEGKSEKSDEKSEPQPSQPKAEDTPTENGGREAGRNTDEPQEFNPTVETMDALNQALQNLVDTDGQEF